MVVARQLIGVLAGQATRHCGPRVMTSRSQPWQSV